MEPKIKQASSFNGKSVSRVRNLSAAFLTALSITFVAAVFAEVGSVQKIEWPDSATASLGDLDLTFGGDGTVVTDLGNNLDDTAFAVAAQPDGKVVVAGYASTGSAGKDFAVTKLNSNGTTDTTFGNSGRLVFNFNSATRDDIARAVAIQPDGKIVVAGEADVLGFGNFDITLARLNADGTFDTTFGSGGKVVTNLPGNRADYGRAVALLPDGRILVAGYSNRATTGDDFVVVRYNPNGSLDTSFNGSGIVTTDVLTGRADAAYSLALQTDGRVVVAGYTNDPSFKNNFAVVRYNTDGSLDSSFNGTGKVTSDLNLNSDDIGNAVTLQSDGKVVVAGQSAADFGLVRYTSSGQLDSSFGGGDGVVITNFGSGTVEAGRAVVIQSNGKITVAGRSQSELALARYNADGTPDNSFDLDGLAVQNAGNNYISGNGGYWGMALQSDGKIVAAGDGWRDGFRNDFAVSRLNANGTFDLSFDLGDGIAATDFRGRSDEARSVAIQSDGKIVVAGTAQNSTGGFDFATARYNPNGTLDTTFDGDGVVITDIQGHPDDAGYAVAIQADGKIIVAGKTDNAGDGNLDDGVLIRYNSNGSLDSTFGNNGITITTGATIVAPNNFATWVSYHDIKVQPDGRIVVAGQAHYFSIHADGLVARYTSNGGLESKALIDFGTEDIFNAVVLQGDGKIVVAGSVGGGAGSDYILARLNTNFSLDSSFDLDGKVLTNFANSNLDAAYDLAIQADGKILAVGETIASGTGSDFAIARYNSNGSLDPTFGGSDGTVHIDFLNYRDYCSGVAIQPDGKIILSGLADGQVETGWGVVKLNPNGTFDTNFGGGSGRVRTLFGDAVGSALNPAPYDMAIQADGKIVVVGRINYNSTSHDFTVVRYDNNFSNCTYSISATSANFVAAGGAGSFNVTTGTSCPWTAQSSVTWITTSSGASGSGPVNFTVAANTGAARTGTITAGGQIFTVTQAAAPGPTTFQLSQSSYTVVEGAGFLSVTVLRGGDKSAPATVKYATSDGTDVNFRCNPSTAGQVTGIASRKCDYHIAAGSIRFAAGEDTKQLILSFVDDIYVEGPETLTLTLNNPSGGTLGQNKSVPVTITDDDVPGKPNPIDQTHFFVRQLYVDLLSREPDPIGWDGWTTRIDQCGQPGQPPPPCDRVTVGGDGFLRSSEFFDRQFFVLRLYKTAFGRILQYSEVGDLAYVSGFLSSADLELNKQELVTDIMTRPEFTTKYSSLGDQAFVDTLLQTAQVTLPSADRNALITSLGANTKTRAQVFREISERPEVSAKHLVESQVVSAYYGFFTRNPDGAYTSYVTRLNSGEINLGDLANAFINAQEYRLRFGP